MMLHLGFDVCVEAYTGHKAHCTIVQESEKESKPKRVQNPRNQLKGARADLIPLSQSIRAA